MKSSRSFTLIEVLAALALLAGAATLILQAQARAMTQYQVGAERTTAARLAEELIADWKLRGATMASAAEGRFEDVPGWRWSRSARPFEPWAYRRVFEVTLAIVHGQGLIERGMAQYSWLEREPDHAR